jgi:hypothetical protein
VSCGGKSGPERRGENGSGEGNFGARAGSREGREGSTVVGRTAPRLDLSSHSTCLYLRACEAVWWNPRSLPISRLLPPDRSLSLSPIPNRPCMPTLPILSRFVFILACIIIKRPFLISFPRLLLPGAEWERIDRARCNLPGG